MNDEKNDFNNTTSNNNFNQRENPDNNNRSIQQSEEQLIQNLKPIFEETTQQPVEQNVLPQQPVNNLLHPNPPTTNEHTNSSFQSSEPKNQKKI